MPVGKPFTKGDPRINPGGRPKALLEVIALAKTHTTAAVATLAEIMNNQDVDPRARVAAADKLLDRGWGKPSQALHVTGELPQAVQIITPLTRSKDNDSKRD